MPQLIVLGSNGTYPTPGRPASGYLVSDGSVSVMLDCGPGTFPALLERGVMPRAIVITHRHGDHCLDVFSLFNHIRFERGDTSGIFLIAPPGVYAALAEFVGAGPSHAFHEVFTRHWAEPGDRLTLGDFTLDFGQAMHPVPTIAVKVAVGGRTLVYSSDTGPGGDLISLASRANVFLCEATYQGKPSLERYQYHLYAREAGELAATAQVEQLLLTHLAPPLEPAVSIAEAAEEYGGPIAHAAPGLEVEL